VVWAQVGSRVGRGEAKSRDFCQRMLYLRRQMKSLRQLAVGMWCACAGNTRTRHRVGWPLESILLVPFAAPGEEGFRVRIVSAYLGQVAKGGRSGNLMSPWNLQLKFSNTTVVAGQCISCGFHHQYCSACGEAVQAHSVLVVRSMVPVCIVTVAGYNVDGMLGSILKELSLIGGGLVCQVWGYLVHTTCVCVMEMPMHVHSHTSWRII